METSAKLAVELWKLMGAFERSIIELPTGRQARAAAQVRYSRSQLETLLENAGLKLVTFDGAKFSASLPASPINAEDLPSCANPRVIKTVEPAVVSTDTVILTGKVLLGE